MGCETQVLPAGSSVGVPAARAALHRGRTSVHHIANAKTPIIKLGGEEKAFPTIQLLPGLACPCSRADSGRASQTGAKDSARSA